MKHIILTAILSVVLFTSTAFASQFRFNLNANKIFTVQSLNDWVEYVLIGNQWYKIIHYSDGLIDAFPVAQPPID